MEGVIGVKAQIHNIPTYPVTDSGKRIDKLPVYAFTPDGKLEVGLSWDPTVLLTGKETTLFVSFFDRANNKPNILPFDFVLTQNGKKLERIPTSAQTGMNVQHYVFAKPGLTSIRIENIGNIKTRLIQPYTIIPVFPQVRRANSHYNTRNHIENLLRSR